MVVVVVWVVPVGGDDMTSGGVGVTGRRSDGGGGGNGIGRFHAVEGVGYHNLQQKEKKRKEKKKKKLNLKNFHYITIYIITWQCKFFDNMLAKPKIPSPTKTNLTLV